MRTLVQLARTAVRGLVQQMAVRSTAELCATTARLPQDTRRVVTLYKVYDETVPQIAARLALTPAQVEQHLVTAALLFSGCIDSSDLRDGAASTYSPPGSKGGP